MVVMIPQRRVDVPDAQMQVVLDIPQGRVQQRTRKQVIDLSMPQAVGAIVERTRVLFPVQYFVSDLPKTLRLLVYWLSRQR